MGSRDPSQSVGPQDTSPLSVLEAELITTLPSKKRFHALVGSLVVAGDVIISWGRGARGVRGARILELV
jgi:hypothetical protein